MNFSILTGIVTIQVTVRTLHFVQTRCGKQSAFSHKSVRTVNSYPESSEGYAHRESDMLQPTNFIFRSRTLVLLCIIFWVAVARPQGRYAAEFTKAEQAYSEGFFDQVIAVVNSCLNKGGLTTAEQARAYKLLGQAYSSKNEPQLAKLYVQKLLEVAPGYEPDREQDLQMWIALVDAAKQERERQIQRQQPPKPPDDKPITQPASTRKSGGKKWLWIGSGGAVVAGTAVYLILKGEDTGKRLPDPPGLPPRP
jgi:hypothetical protein